MRGTAAAAAHPEAALNSYEPTWEDPLGPNAWTTLTWPGQEAMHCGLATIIGLGPRSELGLVGTGFIISAQGNYALCATAAHNFWQGLHRVQTPRPRHHRSALPEFVAGFDGVDLDRAKVIYRHGDAVRSCAMTGAVWVKRSDICFFEIETEAPSHTDFLQGEWLIADQEPRVGDIVGVAAYSDMSVTPADPGSALSAGQIQSRLTMRVGRVTEVRDSGLLTQGRCVETTIPVFGGMSGGPAFLWGGDGPPRAFGFISSDPEDPELNGAAKHDFSVAGRSTVAILSNESEETLRADKVVSLRLGPIDSVLGSLRTAFLPDE